MDVFKCTYLPHEKESIMGFCLNQNCKTAPQFCFKCFPEFHRDHHIDCIRFAPMSQYIQDSLQVYKESSQQIINIIDEINTVLAQFKKGVDQEIQTLNNLDQQLLSNDYSSLKSQISLIKQFYSKEKEKKIKLQLQQLNKIIHTIKAVTQIQTQVNVLIKNGRKIKITEIIMENETDNSSQIIQGLLDEELDNNQNFQDPLNPLDDPISQGIDFQIWKSYGLNNLGRYQEAIECCEQAIQVNPHNDMVWNNKGFALNSLGRYQEAIQSLDEAISINPQNDMAYNNKAFALNSLQRFQDAIQCCNKTLQICPTNHLAHINKGFALHSEEQFQEAIVHYNKALSICDDPYIQTLKSNSEAKLNSKSLINKII